MTLPPLPDSSVVKCEMIFEPPDANQAGSRFYLGFTGSAPSNGDCVTLAGDIRSAWGSNLASLNASEWALNKVDVQDITTRTGNFGEDTTAVNGTRSGTELPQLTAMNVEFKLATRYRGGKPRIFHPPGVHSDTVNEVNWSDTFVGDWQTGIEAFFTAVTGASVGSMGTLSHVIVSYYHLFDNIANSSGRIRAVPRYRTPNALVIPVTGYAPKTLISTQRRRRQSTTP